mmetsp:Transcript_39519/g.95965  ORF Transcript_39519/g.95965 Transcript_39519/m.95965 type:complete len:301 (-) Transcript_39519:514-1416(-)
MRLPNAAHLYSSSTLSAIVPKMEYSAVTCTASKMSCSGETRPSLRPANPSNGTRSAWMPPAVVRQKPSCSPCRPVRPLASSYGISSCSVSLCAVCASRSASHSRHGQRYGEPRMSILVSVTSCVSRPPRISISGCSGIEPTSVRKSEGKRYAQCAKVLETAFIGPGRARNRPETMASRRSCMCTDLPCSSAGLRTVRPLGSRSSPKGHCALSSCERRAADPPFSITQCSKDGPSSGRVASAVELTIEGWREMMLATLRRRVPSSEAREVMSEVIVEKDGRSCHELCVPPAPYMNAEEPLA